MSFTIFIYFFARSAAPAPSAAAVISCLKSFLRQSPAANTPSMSVLRPWASIKPFSSHFTSFLTSFYQFHPGSEKGGAPGLSPSW